MAPFSMPHDLCLAEYDLPFATVDQLAEFILELENDTYGYVVLRTYILEFTYLHSIIGINWDVIRNELRRYPELPHRSLATHGLESVFDAGKKLLSNPQSGL